MGATTSVSQWIHYLQHEILGGFRQALIGALGLFSLAMAEARSCQSGRLASAARSPALPASRRRRWARLLANRHFDSAAAQQALGRAGGAERAAADLCPRPGASGWCGTAEVFKKAGWRTGQVIAQWPRGQRAPWLLLTDQSACQGRWRQYARRMWIEESFRDEKSQGFDWGRSRLRAAARADRLLAVLALALLLAVSLGGWLIKRGYRHEFDPRRRRRLSVFQLGLLALSNVLNGLRPNWPLQLYF